MEKIYFEIESSEYNDTESLWAELSNGLYVVRNTPFFIYNISFGDLIRVTSKDGKLYFTGKVKNSGHSTYRVYVLDKENEQYAFLWDILLSLGCTYEKAKDKLYSIDVPPSADIYKVYEVLELGEKKCVWEFEEGHCGHPLVKESSN